MAKIEGTNWFVSFTDRVVRELDRQSECITDLTKQVNNTNIELAKLKVKAGVWGALAGLIPAIGLLLIWIITGGLV